MDMNLAAIIITVGIILVIVIVAAASAIIRFYRTPGSYYAVLQQQKNRHNRKHFSHARQQRINHQPVGEAALADPIDALKGPIPEDLAHFVLLDSDSVKPEILDKVRELKSSIPRPRAILRTLTRAQLDPDELSKIVKSDPEMAAKILSTANSAFFSASAQITSISHAVMFLGTEMVKNIAMKIAIDGVIKVNDPETELLTQKIWLSSFASSAFCQHLGQTLGMEQISSLSTLSLLSTIGNFALIKYEPDLVGQYLEEYSLFHRTCIEQSMVGMNSAIIGKTLAQEWDLPKVLVEGIELSLLPMAIPPEKCPIKDIDVLRRVVFCYLSNRIGELIIFFNLRDVGEFKLDQQKGCEYYYLKEYLMRTDMLHVLRMLKEPNFRSSMNQRIMQMAP